MNTPNTPYNTPSKKKRFVESEFRRIVKAMEAVDETKVSFLKGSYSTRRQRAILNYLDRAENEFSGFGLNSVIESFVKSEILSIDNYNNLDSNNDLRIGAALWILDKLRAAGKLVDAYKILPDVSKIFDVWYLPIDFTHPCYDIDLIQSVIHAIKII